jgi:hypothetical protein
MQPDNATVSAVRRPVSGSSSPWGRCASTVVQVFCANGCAP